MTPCPTCLWMSPIQLLGQNLSQCPRCEHIFQSDLTPTIDYTANYGASRYDTHSESMSFLRVGYVLGRINTGVMSSVLDIGYGNGLFLKAAQRTGAAIFGVDIHGKDYGIPDVSIDHPCSVATMFDSLEHLPDLSIINRINARYLFISVPHPPPWFAAHPIDWRHFRPGEHLHYFSSESLKTLMRRNRFFCAGESAIEDALRGKITRNGKTYDNIHTYHFERS